VRITIIAAVASNRAIGLEGSIPWHLPADLAFFKRTTVGHTLVMGRRTFESAGTLPGRVTIVLTRDPSWRPPEGGGVGVAHDLDEAIRQAGAAGEEEVFVCGGAGVYARALERADRLVLTRVEGTFDADTFFPEVDLSRWRLVSREEREPDERNRYRLRFEVYERA
jgi:dihydrofolate reductase